MLIAFIYYSLSRLQQIDFTITFDAYIQIKKHAFCLYLPPTNAPIEILTYHVLMEDYESPEYTNYADCDIIDNYLVLGESELDSHLLLQSDEERDKFQLDMENLISFPNTTNSRTSSTGISRRSDHSNRKGDRRRLKLCPGGKKAYTFLNNDDFQQLQKIFRKGNWSKQLVSQKFKISSSSLNRFHRNFVLHGIANPKVRNVDQAFSKAPEDLVFYVNKLLKFNPGATHRQIQDKASERFQRQIILTDVSRIVNEIKRGPKK